MARQAQIVSFENAQARSRERKYSSSISLVNGSRFEEDDLQEDRDSARKNSVRKNSRESEPSRREERRRRRTKERSNRMFDKQYAASEKASASEEGAPRAAIYKGKMGSNQRKSARMQRSSSAGSPSAKINPAGWLASSSITPRTLRIATGVLCVILICAFLYVPAKQYYQAQREHDRLVAEYSIIEDRNESLDVQNDILASDAGMEDAVRQKYGYVKSGEQTAVVTGLSEHATDTTRDSENIEANVLSSSVKTPEEWYTPLLDTFFGVE